MLQYYVAMLYWMRVAMIRSNNGLTTPAEDSLLDFAMRQNITIPAPIAVAINSIGDFTDPSGDIYHWRIQRIPNATGDFGRITSETHAYYEAYPTPQVFRRKIQAEILFSQAPAADRMWDLPADLRPMNIGNVAPIPTKNLVGWSPSVKLPVDAIGRLQACQITANEFVTENSTFQLNIPLFQDVSTQLNSITIMKMSSINLTSRVGSLGQEIGVEKIRNDDPFNRFAMYNDGVVRSRVKDQLDKKFAAGATILGLRCPKGPWPRPTQDNANALFHAYSCYSWNEYTLVPQHWDDHANDVFVFGENNTKLNTFSKSTSSTERARLRTSFVDAFTETHH
jgi:hypothetical protein